MSLLLRYDFTAHLTPDLLTDTALMLWKQARDIIEGAEALEDQDSGANFFLPIVGGACPSSMENPDSRNPCRVIPAPALLWGQPQSSCLIPAVHPPSACIVVTCLPRPPCFLAADTRAVLPMQRRQKSS